MIYVWVVKIENFNLGHNCYKYKYTIGKERKYLRKLENQQSEETTIVDFKKINWTSGNMRACW